MIFAKARKAPASATIRNNPKHEGAPMPDTLQLAPPAPLTTLTEDEVLFRDNIRQFAEEKIRPLVKEMDEKGVFEKDLIHDFFQLGLMGIEIPEQYGGGAAKFFEAILAVEELSRVDASSGVIVDVQNTLVNNALLRWGMKIKRGVTCRRWRAK